MKDFNENNFNIKKIMSPVDNKVYYADGKI